MPGLVLDEEDAVASNIAMKCNIVVENLNGISTVTLAWFMMLYSCLTNVYVDVLFIVLLVVWWRRIPILLFWVLGLKNLKFQRKFLCVFFSLIYFLLNSIDKLSHWNLQKAVKYHHYDALLLREEINSSSCLFRK